MMLMGGNFLLLYIRLVHGELVRNMVVVYCVVVDNGVSLVYSSCVDASDEEY